MPTACGYGLFSIGRNTDLWRWAGPSRAGRGRRWSRGDPAGCCPCCRRTDAGPGSAWSSARRRPTPRAGKIVGAAGVIVVHDEPPALVDDGDHLEHVGLFHGGPARARLAVVGLGGGVEVAVDVVPVRDHGRRPAAACAAQPAARAPARGRRRREDRGRGPAGGATARIPRSRAKPVEARFMGEQAQCAAGRKPYCWSNSAPFAAWPGAIAGRGRRSAPRARTRAFAARSGSCASEPGGTRITPSLLPWMMSPGRIVRPPTSTGWLKLRKR